MRTLKHRLKLAFTLASVLITGCGGGHSNSTGTSGTPSSIAITPAAPAVTVGGTVQLKVTGTFPTTTSDITSLSTFTSSASSVATVSKTGLITGVAAGTSTITATESGVTKTATVTVSAASNTATLTSIALTPTGGSVTVGATQQFTAIGTYTDGSTFDISSTVTWSATPASVATITAMTTGTTAPGGLLTGVGAGTAMVTATLGAISGTTNVTITTSIVPPPAGTPTSIAVTPTGGSVTAGSTQQFTAIATYADATTSDVTSSVTWSASPASSATISTSGLLTAGAAPGTATVKATLGTVVGTTTITVTAGGSGGTVTLTSIAITPNPLAPVVGTTIQLVVTGTYSDGTTAVITSGLTFTSTPSGIVSSSGVLTATGAGAFSVTVSDNGITQTVSGTATAATLTTTSIVASGSTGSIPVGTNLNIQVEATLSDGSQKDVTSAAVYASGTPATATVTSPGVIKAVAVGTSTITITYNGRTTTFPVTVTAASIISTSISPLIISLPNGTTKQLTVTALMSDGTTQDVTSAVHYTVAPALATISPTGLLTANTVGVLAIVSATTSTGVALNAPATLTVTDASLTSIAIAPTPLVAVVGTPVQLTLTGTYSDNSTSPITSGVVYTATPAGTVSVSAAGLVTAIAPGPFSVTATDGSVSKTVTGTATAATPVSIVANGSRGSVPVGTNVNIQVEATLTDGTQTDVTAASVYTSGDITVATVTSPGVIKAIATGTSTITITYGGKTTTFLVTVTPATVVSTTISPLIVAIPSGTTKQLTVTALMSDGSFQDVTSAVTFTVTPASLATINTAGLLTADTPGLLGVIAATTTTGVALNVPGVLTVTPAVLETIALTPANPFVNVGGTLQLTATGTFSDNSTANVTPQLVFTSSNPAVAFVTPLGPTAGTINGLSVGTATITASGGLLGAATQTLVVNVSASPLAGITVTGTTSPITLASGTSTQLTATGTNGDGTTEDLTSSVTWVSSNPAFATVSATGTVMGFNPGVTNITATLGTTASPATPVTVSAATVSSISLTPQAISLAAGQTTPLHVTSTLSDGTTQDDTADASYVVTPSTLASISPASGGGMTLTALTSGTGTVTANLNGQNSTATLNITPSLTTTINVSPSVLSLAAGTTQSLIVNATKSDGTSQPVSTNLTFTSDTPLTASVNSAGTILGLIPGTAHITITYTPTSGAPLTTTLTVTITPATLQSITITADQTTALLGIPLQLQALGTFSDGTVQDITSLVQFSSSDPIVLTVGNTGIVLPISIGGSTVSASLNGKSGTVSLNVGAALLTGITVTAPSTSEPVGATGQLTAMGSYSDGSTHDVTSLASWLSDTPQVAVVSSTGTTTGISVGNYTAFATVGLVTGHTALSITAPTAATLQSITITPTNVNIVGSLLDVLGIGQQFHAVGTYSDGSTIDLTNAVQWSTSNGLIGIVNSEGTLNFLLGGLTSLLGLGSSPLTVSATYQGVTGSTTITVSILAGIL